MSTSASGTFSRLPGSSLNLDKVKGHLNNMEKIREYITESWKSGDPTRFPGPQPISIERRHFSELRRQQYLVCEKGDGERFLLVCLPGSKEVHVVNRNFCLGDTLSIAGFPKDTLLDGEFVVCKDGSWLFLVHDAVRVRGEDLWAAPLTVRLEKARGAVKSIIRSKKDKMEIRVKNMLPLLDLDKLPPLDSFPYATDGLIFTPVNEPIRTGTHETMFKWKPRLKNTVDFLILNGNEIWVADHPWKHIGSIYNKGRWPDGTILECEYGDVGWQPVRLRPDKDRPNNVRTYERTCVNLREDIKLSEFLSI